MNGRLALSFAVAAMIVGVGGLYVVWHRLGRLEERMAARDPAPRGRPPGVVPAPTRGGTTAEPLDPAPADPQVPTPVDPEDPVLSRDPLVKLDYLVKSAQEADDHAYEYYTDLSGDLHAVKREVSQLKSTLRQVVQGLNRPGGEVIGGIGWGLAPREKPVDEATKKAYRAAAEAMGVKVEDGRVTVRGFLNLSPNTSMPIEYFMTRFPEAGHETLVHLLGSKTIEELQDNPWGGLKGLATALYKGLVAAGFREGMGTHVDPASDPKDPKWVLAAGDTVYMGAIYEQDGKKVLARATDWVIEDPKSGSVLPPDCFRFTGSARAEDPDTGEELLAAEMRGLLVSVWPNASALVEVALESALRNEYTYNFTKIPKGEGDQPLFLEMVFSKTPIDPAALGAEKPK